MVTLLEITFDDDDGSPLGRVCIGHYDNLAEAAQASQEYANDPVLEWDPFDTRLQLIEFKRECPFCPFEAGIST